MWRDGERQMGRRKGGEKWRVARWNKLLTDCVRNIFGEPFLIGCVCVWICTSFQSCRVIWLIRQLHYKYKLTLCLHYSVWVCTTLFSVDLVCVFVLVHHYTHDLSVMLLETPVCNGWKSALPAGLVSNC